jgi:hypothetical protein
MQSSVFVLIIMTLSLCTSCDNADFVEFSELGGLRIVGVEASTPEIDGTSTATESVTLTPFISDIDAAGRVFSVTVTSCIDPTFSQTGTLGCSNPTSESYPNGNSFDTNTLAASSFTGAMDPITININNPASLISQYPSQLQFNGVPLFVFFTISSGNESLSFVKEILITNRGQLNQNPEIEDIVFNGSSLASGPSQSGELNVTFTDTGGPQSFLEISSDGSTIDKTESFLISWFTSTGQVVPGRVLLGDSSELTTIDAAVIICVVRDRRGGTDVRILTP